MNEQNTHNNQTHNNLSKTILPWYLSTIFISCLLFVSTLFLFILFPIGVIMIIGTTIVVIVQYKELQAITAKIANYNDIETFKKQTEQHLNDLKEKTDIDIKRRYDTAENELITVNSNIENAQKIYQEWLNKISESKKELDTINKETLISYVSTYDFDETITSEEYKNKLSILRLQQKDFIKSSKAIKYNDSITTVSKQILNNNVKQLLRCFNSETSNIINNVTVKNIDTCRNKLQKTFETLNKIFKTDGIGLNEELLQQKLDELTLLYNYQLKLEQEREQQKAIKEQMIEEEKVRREIEREKAKIEKEEIQFKNEISKLMTYLQKASDIEKQLYVDKIKELEEKIKNLEKDKENVLQREANTRAGFVYIISNIGSFGENVYKIGMTRRLEPMDRVKELSSASVPFEFDVHAMIFSDDAPYLENVLHKTFEKNAVNKINPRKEFYRVNLKEIEQVVKKNHNATVTFTEIAKAEQYRETLRLSEQAN